MFYRQGDILKHMKQWFVTRRHLVLALSSILLTCLALNLVFGFPGFLFRAGMPLRAATQKTSALTHLTGGFQIGTPSRVDDAASDGITTVFNYEPAFSPQSTLGQEFTKMHMSLIVGGPASYLFFINVT